MKTRFRSHKIKKIRDSIIIEDEEKKEGTEELFKKVQTAMSERPKKILTLYVKVPSFLKKILHPN